MSFLFLSVFLQTDTFDKYIYDQFIPPQAVERLLWEALEHFYTVKCEITKLHAKHISGNSRRDKISTKLIKNNSKWYVY